MYIPKYYEGHDLQETVAFMRRYNFGTIITSANQVPLATHLPFVISESNDQIIITSHFAKANQHWEHIVASENLVIFTEPHAYISPKNYNKKENVPTWNYLSVHAYGKAKIIDNEKEVMSALKQMMDNFEPEYKTQWKALPDAYKSGMAKGIVVFEIKVSKLQSKQKLSQNKKENERQSIIDSFSKSDDMNERTIAEYMEGKECPIKHEEDPK